jgi:Ca2+-binding RTX toxin-like protein
MTDGKPNQGDDLIWGYTLRHTYDGGAGSDTISYEHYWEYPQKSNIGLTVDLANMEAFREGFRQEFFDVLISIENAIGSRYNDKIIVGGVAGLYQGLAGNDAFFASANGSTLHGGDGIDTASYQTSQVGVIIDLASSTPGSFNGTSGDTLVSIENVTGSNFDDRMIVGSTAGLYQGLAGNDAFFASANGSTLDGGDGSDTVSYQTSQVGVIVDLASSTPGSFNGTSGDTLVSIENVTGSGFDDRMIVGSTAGLYQGLAGNDAFFASANGSTLDGGDGIDTVSYERSAVGVIIDLASSTPGSFNGTSGDTLVSIENVTGSNFDDRMIVGSTAGLYQGLAGNDAFFASANGSTLDGGDGSDTVSYQTSQVGVIIDLASTTPGSFNGTSGDTLISIENVTGSGFDDRMIVGSTAGLYQGLAGNDAFTPSSPAPTAARSTVATAPTRSPTRPLRSA